MNSTPKRNLKTAQEIWKFVYDLSPTLNERAGTTTTHGAGHLDDTINSSLGAFMLCSVILITATTLFIGWKVYKNNDLMLNQEKKQDEQSKELSSIKKE